ncbi:MAG: hypothetical protein H7263_09375 [Candidatus Sericytochromatia bacterium]|nr:hypothetical protein [Candidatus Sericytochromatia bacterium]
MAANYKTPGKKEFKKISYLKQMMMEPDPLIRKQAVFLFNQVTKTPYDKEIEELEKKISDIEKALRLSEKKRAKDSDVKSLKKKISADFDGEDEEEEEIKVDSSDTYINQELAGLNFKLKYLKLSKDIEIDAKLVKTKVTIK